MDSGDGTDRSRRKLYWWPNPVGPDGSAEAGQRMATGTIVWFVSLVAVVIVIGLVFAAID